MQNNFNEFNKDGFDINGMHRNTTNFYNEYGFNKDGVHQSHIIDYDVYHLYKKDSISYYSPEGFNIKGLYIGTDDLYNLLGYDRDGYDRKGFNKEGFNKDGDKYNYEDLDVNNFNKDGKFKNTDNEYDERGFKKDRTYKESNHLYNEYGYDINGFNEEGFNEKRVHKSGKYNEGYLFDENGYNINGFNNNGVNKETGNKYNKYGFKREGNYQETETKYDVREFKLDKTYRETNSRYDNYGFDIDRLNKHGFDKEGNHKDTGTRYNLEGFNEYEEHETTNTKYDPKGFDIDGNHIKSQRKKKRLNWEEKLDKFFGDEITDNGNLINYENNKLPKYVTDYIFANYENKLKGKGESEKAEDYIEKYLILSEDKKVKQLELFKNKKLKIIDRFKGNFKEVKKEIKYKMEIPSLDIVADIDMDLLFENTRLLKDGVWGIGEISYKENEYTVDKFIPFQIKEIKLLRYKEGREEFTTKEWINIMINTLGLNHNNYSQREKIILISRQIPMVEENTFMMEFSDPGTGKTYTYENVSSYSRVISGSHITAPQLFYNSQSKQDGALVKYDSLLFDEIDKIGGTGLDKEVTNKLYQYLNSGQFDRGKVEKTSNCSIMMVGNLPNGYNENSDESLLKECLHETLTHPALLDRLAGIIPGWELQPLKNPKDAYSKNMGFSKDYFSEILHEIKSSSYLTILNRLDYDENTTQRDKKSISKMLNGMIKLIYPHGTVPKRIIRIIEIINGI